MTLCSYEVSAQKSDYSVYVIFYSLGHYKVTEPTQQNPVERGYVDWAGDYRYSSARQFDGRESLLKIESNW